MKKLRNHIERLGISEAEFARRVPCSKGYLSAILSGAKTAGINCATRISRATGGEITVSDLRPDWAEAIIGKPDSEGSS